jgi:DNA (cytosine-5)-methyltransferase 1
MTAYYNEHDPYAAAWLRNLIDAGHIAHGVVDERSIEDVYPSDIDGFKQCHFFAGIGVWSYALRRSGWSDDRPIWTGSCPCQPFSEAGKGTGFADERHLWPAFHHLIGQCKPPVVFGEQVASADGLAWLDLVHTDMEAAGYAFGAVDLCAAGVGAPHIRQRLWFVGELADTDDTRLEGREGMCERPDECTTWWPSFVDGGLANTDSARREQRQRHDQATRHGDSVAATCGDAGHQSAGPTNGFWRDADWLACRDDRWRPVEPGTFPLANGSTARVGRLRAYGNAIVAEAAGAVIKAYMGIE